MNNIPNENESNRWTKALSFALPCVLLLAVLAFVGSQVERPSALVRVWIPWAQIGSIALVMTLIIVSGGIDLSVGSIAALCMVVLGVLWQDAHLPLGWAIAATLATGCLCGGINSLLISSGLSPLICTVATMAVFSGLAMLISGAQRISGFPESLLAWKRVYGVPTEYVLFLVVAGVSAFFLHATRYGRWCFAAGENRVAARFAGVPLMRLDGLLYTASGILAALLAISYVMYRDAAVPDAMRGVELKAIACVVVGGTHISGGRGSIGRTLLGVAIVSLLDIGLEFLGTRVRIFSAEARLVILGALLIAAAIWNQRLSPRD